MIIHNIIINNIIMMHEEDFDILIHKTRYGEIDVVEEEIRREPSLIHRTDRFGCTLLWNSIVLDDRSEFVQILLNYGALVNIKTGYNQETSLMRASIKNFINSAKVLLDNKADINAIDTEENTALHHALIFNNINVCELLLLYGANLMAINKKKQTPLEVYYTGRIYDSPLPSSEDKAAIFEHLTAIWHNGPHPTQVQRRKDEIWIRRWPFVQVAVFNGFQLSKRRIDLLKAIIRSTSESITPIDISTPEKYHAFLLGQVFSLPGVFRLVCSFL